MEDPDRPLKDYGSFVHVQPSEADIAGMIQLIYYLIWLAAEL